MSTQLFVFMLKSTPNVRSLRPGHFIPSRPFHFIPPAVGDAPISPAVMTLALSIVRGPRSGARPPARCVSWWISRMCQRRAVPSKGGRRLEEGRVDERGRKVNSAGRLHVCAHTCKSSGEFCCGDKGPLVAAQRGVDFGKPVFSALVSGFWKLLPAKALKVVWLGLVVAAPFKIKEIHFIQTKKHSSNIIHISI